MFKNYVIRFCWVYFDSPSAAHLFDIFRDNGSFVWLKFSIERSIPNSYIVRKLGQIDITFRIVWNVIYLDNMQ